MHLFLLVQIFVYTIISFTLFLAGIALPHYGRYMHSVMLYKLSDKAIEQFITEGFVRIDDAFSSVLAKEIVDRLWNDIPFEKSDPGTWTEPVVRLGMYALEPFVASVNTPKLHAAFNQLTGFNKWLPCRSVGTFPVRFPSGKQPDDTGRHVDTSFPGSNPNDYFSWRSNVRSKGRALLMLALYSDVGPNDAPTVIYKGSHIDVAKLLHPAGEAGLTFMEIADRLDELPEREPAYATGKAGTVYLCHPFLVHAAQAHKGSTPRFMAQPPLLSPHEFTIEGSETGHSPVEQAIRLGLE